MGYFLHIFYIMQRGGQTMDIASLSMNMATSQTQNSVSISVLAKSLDNLETLGNGLVEIIDAAAMVRSVTPYLGSNIDVTV